jgi:hypothetical protein
MEISGLAHSEKAPFSKAGKAAMPASASAGPLLHCEKVRIKAFAPQPRN